MIKSKQNKKRKLKSRPDFIKPIDFIDTPMSTQLFLGGKTVYISY